MIRRFGRVRELFSTDGAPTQLFELFGQGTPLPVLSPSFAVALYGIMIFALLCGVFGFQTRLAFLIGRPAIHVFQFTRRRQHDDEVFRDRDSRPAHSRGFRMPPSLVYRRRAETLEGRSSGFSNPTASSSLARPLNSNFILLRILWGGDHKNSDASFLQWRTDALTGC